MSDAVNPDHYKRLPAEAIEIIESAIDNAPSNQDAYLHGQVLKYILRCWHKNGIEDLRKAKWYLNRLIDSFDASETEQLATGEVNPPDDWRPNDNVSLAMQMAANSFGGKDGVFNGANFSNAMRQLAGVTCNLDGYVVATILDGRTDVEVLKGGSHYKYLFWSPGNTQSIEQPAEAPEATGEATGEVKPPDGWRWLEVGEVIRNGDLPWEDGRVYATEPIMLGMALQAHWKPMIRRNKFEVGEKVVHVDDKELIVYVVEGTRGDGAVIFSYKNIKYAFSPDKLAPYIEEAK